MKNKEGFFDQLRKQLSSTAISDLDDEEDKHSIDSPVLKEEFTVGIAPTDESITAYSNDGGNRNYNDCNHNGSRNENDTGNESIETQRHGMPPEARRALVSLLRQGVILSAQKSKLFESICRYQVDIRRHFADMYLKLILDEKSGVAFVASIDEEDAVNRDLLTLEADLATNDYEEDTVSLITRRTLSLFDTLLLLVLRKHYQERETSGEQKVVIDIERVESNLTPFLPLTNNSKSDRRKLNAALQKMVEKRLLSSVRGSEDRYEITPIIRYVANAAFLESMLVDYQRLAIEAGMDTEGAVGVSLEQEGR